MNSSRIVGVIFGVALAYCIQFGRGRTNRPGHDAATSNGTVGSTWASPVQPDSGPVESITDPADQTGRAKALASTQALAAIKSEQQRFIALTTPLEHNAKRLGITMISLLRELDVNRMVRDGDAIDARGLMVEIETSAPTPTVPYGPKLGLVPTQ